MHEIKLNQLNSKQIKSIRIGLNRITSNQLSPRAAPRSSVGRRASGARQLARAAGRAPGHDGSIVTSNVGSTDGPVNDGPLRLGARLGDARGARIGIPEREFPRRLAAF